MSQYNYILWEKILAVAFCRNHQWKNVNDTVGTAVSLLHRAQRSQRWDFRSETKCRQSARWRAGAARVPSPSSVSSRVPTSEQVDLPRAGVVRCTRGLAGDGPSSVRCCLLSSQPHCSPFQRTPAFRRPSAAMSSACVRKPAPGYSVVSPCPGTRPVPPSSARVREPVQSLLSCREASHGPQRAGAGGTWRGQLQ